MRTSPSHEFCTPARLLSISARLFSIALGAAIAALAGPAAAVGWAPAGGAVASAAFEQSKPASGIGQLFIRGEEALQGGDLDGAEKVFDQVLATDPRNAGAYANLGVIAMRRKQWPR
ncbi:MAG: tetratricopeptide repeat protein, partial [Terriglobia bacterium]